MMIEDYGCFRYPEQIQDHKQSNISKSKTTSRSICRSCNNHLINLKVLPSTLLHFRQYQTFHRALTLTWAFVQFDAE